jgi:hypothetical protein
MVSPKSCALGAGAVKPSEAFEGIRLVNKTIPRFVSFVSTIFVNFFSYVKVLQVQVLAIVNALVVVHRDGGSASWVRAWERKNRMNE